MKRHSFFYLAAILLLLTACTDKEPKDFEKVMQSTEITLLQTYLETYKKAPLEHMSAVKKRLAELQKDSMLFAAISHQPEIELRYGAAQKYIMELPNGIHSKEVKKIIARDSAEVEKICAEREAARAAAEAEAELEEFRNLIQNAWFISSDGNVVALSVPDKEGKGYGMHFNQRFPQINFCFTYSAKPGTNSLIGHIMSNDNLFTITIYENGLFWKNNGHNTFFQTNPLSEADYKQLQSKVIECVKNYKKEG